LIEGRLQSGDESSCPAGSHTPQGRGEGITGSEGSKGAEHPGAAIEADQGHAVGRGEVADGSKDAFDGALQAGPFHGAARIEEYREGKGEGPGRGGPGRLDAEEEGIVARLNGGPDLMERRAG